MLGTLAMIDDGEADWKMMVIDVTDPLAAELNNLEDVERLMPGFLAATRDWFRWDIYTLHILHYTVSITH